MVLKWAGSPQVPILQYFQIHRSYQNAWSFSISRFPGPQKAWSFSISRFTGRKSSFEISKYTFFEICSEIRVSGPSHSIRLVKSVSKNSARAQINSKFWPKINFLMKNRKNRPNSSVSAGNDLQNSITCCCNFAAEKCCRKVPSTLLYEFWLRHISSKERPPLGASNPKITNRPPKGDRSDGFYIKI